MASLNPSLTESKVDGRLVVESRTLSAQAQGVQIGLLVIPQSWILPRPADFHTLLCPSRGIDGLSKTLLFFPVLVQQPGDKLHRPALLHARQFYVYAKLLF